MKKLFVLSLLATLIPLLSTAQNPGSQVFETRTLKSEILNMDRRYAIYLPPGYDLSDRSYPVLYLLHGSGDNHTGWVQFGEVQRIADKAIAEGKATPMIIVMPDADAPLERGTRGYFNTVNGKFNYEDFFFRELIPYIEKTYRCRTERRYRAIAGLSMGGGGTIYYALHHPEMFAAACPMSASLGSLAFDDYWENRLATAVKTGVSREKALEHYKRHNAQELFSVMDKETLDNVKKIRWYITCGDDDFLYEGNALFHILLRKNNIPHEYRVKDGAHTWSYWRMELPEALDFVSKSFTQY